MNNHSVSRLFSKPRNILLVQPESSITLTKCCFRNGEYNWTGNILLKVGDLVSLAFTSIIPFIEEKVLETIKHDPPENSLRDLYSWDRGAKDYEPGQADKVFMFLGNSFSYKGDVLYKFLDTSKNQVKWIAIPNVEQSVRNFYIKQTRLLEIKRLGINS